MNQETVSIVMASFNGEKYLKEQMDSLLSQTYENIRIEVCDDGSTDGTEQIISEYRKKDERIFFHKNEANKGYVKNFLEGIKRAEGRYIMLCDQDDIWNIDKVENTLLLMKKEEKKYPSKPILVFTDAVLYDSETECTTGLFHENSHLDTKKVDTAHLFMENKVIGCTAMVNRNILPYLEEIPREVRVHDWWLALICSHFGRIVYDRNPTLLYRQHSGNQIGGSSFLQYVKDRISSVQRQREALRASYRQGEIFLQMFGDRMTQEQLEIAEAFAGMEDAGWLKRRRYMLKYGFEKSGVIRNIGLFLLI